MTEADCLDELADILNVPLGTLTLETPLDACTWDSMALLAYLAFLRFHFNITLPNATCADFKTVKDLVRMAGMDRDGMAGSDMDKMDNMDKMDASK